MKKITEMSSTIYYTTLDQLEQTVKVYKEHFQVVSVSKEYCSGSKKRVYINYNMKSSH